MTAHRPPDRSARRPPDPDGVVARPPAWIFVGFAVIVLGLVCGIVLVSYQAINTNNRLTALEQYVSGKGTQRDAENAAQNRRIDDAVCSVLDQLPAGGRLDLVRAQYRCGPGQPPAADTPAPAAAGSTPSPPTGAGPARATAGRTAPPQPAVTGAPTSPARPSGAPLASSGPPASTPAASTTATPAGPITAVLCGVLPQLCPHP